MAVISTLVSSLPSASAMAVYGLLALVAYIAINILSQLVSDFFL
jgi:hypothetical protein